MYEACRRMGHAWDLLSGPPAGMEQHRRDVWMRCTRCTTVRTFDIAPTGEALWNRYFYPEGYQWKDRTVPAPTKSDYRIAWLQDIIASRKARR